MTMERTLERLHHLASSRGEQLAQVETIKASFIMPFLKALGHDPFDPDQVVAAHTTGQNRVDFAAFGEDGAIQLALSGVSRVDDVDHARWRNVSASVAGTGAAGVLTNGSEWRFHLPNDRGMETEPFLSFNLAAEPLDAAALLRLQRTMFDLEGAVADARVTRLDEIAYDALVEELEQAGTIAALLAARLSGGEEPTPRITNAASAAIARAARVLRGDEPAVAERSDGGDQEEGDASRRPLTGDEDAAYRIACEIAAKFVNSANVVARPAQAYVGVLYQDNNRKTICRLYFSAHSTKYIGTFVGRKETKHRIQSYADIAQFADHIEARLRELDPGAFDGRSFRDDRTNETNDTRPVDEIRSEEDQPDGGVADDLGVTGGEASGAAKQPVVLAESSAGDDASETDTVRGENGNGGDASDSEGSPGEDREEDDSGMRNAELEDEDERQDGGPDLADERLDDAYRQ